MGQKFAYQRRISTYVYLNSLVGDVSPSLRPAVLAVLRYPLLGNRFAHFEFHKQLALTGTPEAIIKAKQIAEKLD
jgi:hypothetical protein